MIVKSAYTLRSLVRRPDILSNMSRRDLLSSAKYAEKYLDALVKRYSGGDLDFTLADLGIDRWTKTGNLKGLTDSQLRSVLQWVSDTLNQTGAEGLVKGRIREKELREIAAGELTEDVLGLEEDYEFVTDVDVAKSMLDMQMSQRYNIRKARYSDIATFWGYTSGDAEIAAIIEMRLTNAGFNREVGKQYYEDASDGIAPRPQTLTYIRPL